MLFCFRGSLATKYMSLNDKPYMSRPALIDLNRNKLHCYPFMVSLGRCNETFNTFAVPCSKIFIPNKTKFKLCLI